MAANRKAPFGRLYWFQSKRIFESGFFKKLVQSKALAPLNRPNGDSVFAAMGRSNNNHLPVLGFFRQIVIALHRLQDFLARGFGVFPAIDVYPFAGFQVFVMIEEM